MGADNFDRVQIMIQPKIQHLGTVALASQIKPEAFQPHFKQGKVAVVIKIQLNNRGFPGMGSIYMTDLHRININRTTGTKMADLPFDRMTVQHTTGRNLLPVGDPLLMRIEAHDGMTGNRPEIVGPQHADHRVSKLGEFIVNLFPESTGQKSKALEQTLDIGISVVTVKITRQLRMDIRKFPPLLSQESKFIPEVFVLRHC